MRRSSGLGLTLRGERDFLLRMLEELVETSKKLQDGSVVVPGGRSWRDWESVTREAENVVQAAKGRS